MFYLKMAAITTSNNTFQNSYMSYRGTAFSLSSCTFTDYGSTFLKLLSEKGGAIYLVDTNANFYNTVF